MRLVYPFSPLDTGGALQGLSNIDFSRVKSAKMVVEVWAKDKTITNNQILIDLCDKHEINLTVKKQRHVNNAIEISAK